MHDLTEARARQQIRERVTRAAEPHLPRVPTRHKVADQLRRLAQRLDG